MSKIKNWMTAKAIAFQTRDEEGQGLAEYGLILALVAVMCVLALTALSDGIQGTLNDVAGSL